MMGYKIRAIAASIAVIGLLSLGFWRWYGRVHVAVCAQDIPLIVGTNVGYPPFIMTNDDGRIIGFDHDVAEAIGHVLKRPIEWKDMAFDALLIALQQGKVDMIIGGISISQERKKRGLLVPYYGGITNSVSVFCRKNDSRSFRSIDDLAHSGLTVCIQSGNSFEEILDTIKGVTVKTFADLAELVLEVQYGKSDIGMLDPDTVRILVEKNRGLVRHMIVLPRELHVEGFGIGIAPHNQALRLCVKKALATLKRHKVLEILATKWFGAKKEGQ